MLQSSNLFKNTKAEGANRSASLPERQSRSHGRAVGICSQLLLRVALLLTFPAISLASASTGDFLVANYSTGTAQNNNFLWRGYVFRPSRDVVVEGLYGGSGTNCKNGGFNGAIFEVTLNADNTYTVGSILRTVQFAANQNLTQEYIAFSPTLTLYGDRYYLMAQGRVSSGSGCHYATTALDFNNLQIGAAIIGEWFPAADRALNHGLEGNGTHLEQKIFSFTNVTDVRVLMGFRYQTTVLPARLRNDSDSTTAFQLDGTNNVVVSSILEDSRQTAPSQSLTLYFEFATNPSFSGSTLQPAAPFTVNGPAKDLPFGATLTGLAQGTTYHVRAVAINEAGRTNANAISFTIGSMDDGFPVTATASTGGAVTPSTRAVQAGQATTFVAQPNTGFVRADNVGGTCPAGNWEGNTWTTGTITASCNVEINFVFDGQPSVSTSTVTLSPELLIAGSGATSTVAVQLRNAAGVNLESSAGTVTLELSPSDAGALSNVTDNQNGSYTAIYTAGSLLGNVEVRALLGDAPLAAFGLMELVPGPPAALVVLDWPKLLILDAIAEPFVLEVQDAFGNRTQSEADIQVTIAQGSEAVFVGSTTSVTAVAGRASFSDLRVQGLAGPLTLTFSAAGLTPAIATVNLAEIARLLLSVEARIAPAPTYEASLGTLHPGDVVEFKATFSNQGVEATADTVLSLALATGFRLLAGNSSASVVCPHVGSAPAPVMASQALSSSGEGVVLTLPLLPVCGSSAVPAGGVGWVTFTLEAW